MFVALAVSAGYLLWRLNEAKATGGVVTFVNPFGAYLPGEPSPAGSDGTGNPNMFSEIFAALSRAFKMPGNASSIPAVSSSLGTPVNPVGPPDTVTRTAQPEGPAFIDGSVEYLPNLGDANFSAWNYLATTPPDLAWGMKDG